MEIGEYRTCMSAKMKCVSSKTLSKTERKIEFSLSAKVCSGKAENEKEALKMIKTDHPEWFHE